MFPSGGANVMSLFCCSNVITIKNVERRVSRPTEHLIVQTQFDGKSVAAHCIVMSVPI